MAMSRCGDARANDSHGIVSAVVLPHHLLMFITDTTSKSSYSLLPSALSSLNPSFACESQQATPPSMQLAAAFVCYVTEK